MKLRRRRTASVVFCGRGNHVCDRAAVARAIREQARTAAITGHLPWK